MKIEEQLVVVDSKVVIHVMQIKPKEGSSSYDTNKEDDQNLEASKVKK